MGKLNYTNRKSEGLKLGQIVAKDLRKRVATFSKSKTPPEPSPLELNLPGKSLKDDGLREVAAGLEYALVTTDGLTCSRLEELNLANNALTTASLRMLAPVIRLAAYDLRDLDLSENNICVSTDNEARDWEIFLKAFRDCRVLRRLDLSNNNLAGPRAFEIFARAYFQHSPVDPTELEDARHADGRNGSDGDLAALERQTKAVSIRTRGSSDPLQASKSSLSTATILKRRCGLRSVPYIILSNVSMTDSGALHFSYVLSQHYFPQHLMCPLKAGHAATQLEEYDVTSNCWGLVHLPNDKLSSTGHKVLEQAELARQDLLGISDDVTPQGSLSSYVMVNAMSNFMERRRSSTSPSIKRRASTVSADSGKVFAQSEAKRSAPSGLESSRRKLQRNTIEEYGPNGVELWSAALKMLKYARAVVLVPEVESMNHIADMQLSQNYATEMVAMSANVPEPVFAITGTSDTPSDPHVTDFTQQPHINGTTSKRSMPDLEPDSRPSQTTMKATIELDDQAYYDSTLTGNLPKYVWQRITAFATDGVGILSEEQQKAVMQYAQDRSTLTTEMEALGKLESVQIWRTLEGIGCLAYDMRL